MEVLLAAAVFAAGFAIDFADSRNTLAVSQHRRYHAANWSVLMYVLGLFSIYSVVEVDLWLAVPTAAGFWTGSWAAVGPTQEPGPSSEGSLVDDVDESEGRDNGLPALSDRATPR